MTLSEPGLSGSTSQFQAEPVEGRRVSKVVKTTVVQGERMEKHLGDSSLATDLPSAKDDFEKVQNHLPFAVCTCFFCFVFEERMSRRHVVPCVFTAVCSLMEDGKFLFE